MRCDKRVGSCRGHRAALYQSDHVRDLVGDRPSTGRGVGRGAAETSRRCAPCRATPCAACTSATAVEDKMPRCVWSLSCLMPEDSNRVEWRGQIEAEVEFNHSAAYVRMSCPKAGWCHRRVRRIFRALRCPPSLGSRLSQQDEIANSSPPTLQIRNCWSRASLSLSEEGLEPRRIRAENLLIMEDSQLFGVAMFEVGFGVSCHALVKGFAGGFRGKTR